MSEELFVEPTLDEAVARAIEHARVEAIQDGEACCILVCVDDSGNCPRRNDGSGCEFCNKITVDKFGKVSREAMQ